MLRRVDETGGRVGDRKRRKKPVSSMIRMRLKICY
jgi:hypothetical protein